MNKLESQSEKNEKFVEDIARRIHILGDALEELYGRYSNIIHQVELLSVIVDSVVSLMIDKSFFTKEQLKEKVTELAAGISEEHDKINKEIDKKLKKEHYENLMNSDEFGNA